MSPDHRISLADRAPPPAPAELEAVFIGPATPVNAAAAADAVAQSRRLGFRPEADNTALTNLPLAFSSTAVFSEAYPDDTGWTARAVRDYFAAGGQRAWVVRVAVDPLSPTDGHFRRTGFSLRAERPSGIEVAMQIPDAGLLVMPELEYLCVAAAVTAAPALPTLPPPLPGFRPASDFVAPAAPTLPPRPGAGSAVTPRDVLLLANRALMDNRPDMLCLFGLPVGADETQATATLIQRASDYLYGGGGPDLPQVQAFAPLVRGRDGVVASPSGMIAGTLAQVARTDGVWRSIAGRRLPLGYAPVRRIESAALDRMRRNGVATLRYGADGMALDDDTLAVRTAPGSALRSAGGTRRLMGWLLRNLRQFGEQLVFENMLDEGLVELILFDLFDSLLRRGALNGRQVTDAVRVTRRRGAGTAVRFDIAINTAVALETIQLRFRDGELSATFGAAA